MALLKIRASDITRERVEPENLIRLQGTIGKDVYIVDVALTDRFPTEKVQEEDGKTRFRGITVETFLSLGTKQAKRGPKPNGNSADDDVARREEAVNELTA